MSRRRIIQWTCACAAALVIAAGLILVRQSSRPRLPAPARYGSLPDAFHQALQRARARAESTGLEDDTRVLARLYQANRLYPEARACYKVIAAGRGGLGARDHYYLADMAQQESDLDQACVELRAALRAEPAYVPARIELADALFKTGRADDAAKEYAAVLEIEADQPQAMFGLARVELQQANDDGAEARLEELVARHPESTSGEALLASILDRRGRNDEAAAMKARSSRQTSRSRPIPG